MILGSQTTQVQAADPAGWGQATIWWQPAAGAVKYRIYYREAQEKTYSHAARGIGSDATNYTINYLKSGVTYVYNLTAVDALGKEFWWSGEKKFRAGSTTAHPATGRTSMPEAMNKPLFAVAGSSWATAKWGWQAKAEHYNVYYREAGEKNYTHSVPNIPANGTSLTINYLKNRVGYYYNVAAVYDGKEHWLGEKVLLWPVEVVTIKDQSYAPQAVQPTPDPFALSPTSPPTVPTY